jgi:hypothetical protein
MNRWAARILGLFMLLIFALLFLNLQKTLMKMQQMNAPTATTTR